MEEERLQTQMNLLNQDQQDLVISKLNYLLRYKKYRKNKQLRLNAIFKYIRSINDKYYKVVGRCTAPYA